MRLATFVQVSDLHFGLMDVNTLNANNSWWMIGPFSGVLGHHFRYAINLMNLFTQLTDDEAAELIVTGDLTACGKDSEFQLLDLYLGANPTSAQLKNIGLSVGNWKDKAIPGNHDHWPGTSGVFGGPTATLTSWFGGPARVGTPVTLTTGHRLQFLWVNTDADVSPLSKKRLLATGSFVSQLDHLTNQRATWEDAEIKVLCMHHSPTHRGKTLEIDKRSRARLQAFIVEHGVAVILCGHLHNPPLVGISRAVDPVTTVSRDYLEARCGTTTQVQRKDLQTNRALLRLLALLGVNLANETNSLLVHRLNFIQGGLHWETTIYLDEIVNNRTEFTKPQGLALSNGQAITTSFKVWP